MCFVIFGSNVCISCFLPLFTVCVCAHWGVVPCSSTLVEVGGQRVGVCSPHRMDAENEVKLSGQVVVSLPIQLSRQVCGFLF